MLAALILLSALANQPQSNVPTPAPAPSARADHLALHVADLDKSVAFYTRYLGLQPMRAAARINTVRWLQAGSFEIHLIGGRTKPVQVPIDVHLALRVQDLTAVMARLEADKIAWSDSDGNPHVTQTRRDGIRQLYLQDPDGYWIEVNELPIPGS